MSERSEKEGSDMGQRHDNGPTDIDNFLTKSEELAKELSEFGVTDLTPDRFRKRMGANGLCPAEEEYLIEKVSELESGLRCASKALSKTLKSTDELASLREEIRLLNEAYSQVKDLGAENASLKETIAAMEKDLHKAQHSRPVVFEISNEDLLHQVTALEDRIIALEAQVRRLNDLMGIEWHPEQKYEHGPLDAEYGGKK